MKVIELLTEEISGEISPEIIKRISADCQPFLSVAGKSPIWRGVSKQDDMMRELKPSFYVGAVRNDRIASDTAERYHNAINNYFIKYVGIPVRSASLFVSRDRSVAKEYARGNFRKPLAIFPIGEFHYAWSPHVLDLYLAISARGENVFTELMDAAAIKVFGQTMEEEERIWNPDVKTGLKVFIQMLKDNPNLYNFDSGFGAAGTGEMMVVCDKYYAVAALTSQKARTLMVALQAK